MSRHLVELARRLASLVPFLFLSLVGSVAFAQGWMHWPVSRSTSQNAYVTQGFYGDYIGYCCSSGTNCRAGCGTHNGYDYGIGVGTPLYAVAPGVVDAVHAADARSDDYGRAGRWVRVRHDEQTLPGLGTTYFVAYLHMDTIAVSPGDVVSSDTVLGTSGNSGGVAAHLHLHVATDRRFCSAPVDPGCPTAPHVAGSVIPGFAAGSACETTCKDVPILWKSPAMYGDEPYEDLCDGLDFSGRCVGDVLEWCENGRPNEVDCTESGRACGDNGPEIGLDCLTCAELGPSRCEGDRHLQCDGDGTRSTLCEPGTCDAVQGCVASRDDMGAPGVPDAGVATPSGRDTGHDTGGRSDMAAPVDHERVVGTGGICAAAGSRPSRLSLGLLLAFLIAAAVRGGSIVRS